jgi:hypothetical protein
MKKTAPGKFGATNKPRTCLWCGGRLYSRCSDRWLKRNLVTRANEVSSPISGEQWVREHYAMFHGLYGKHDGLFCSDKCAIEFGSAAARNGYRFKPEAQ